MGFDIKQKEAATHGRSPHRARRRTVPDDVAIRASGNHSDAPLAHREGEL